MSNTQLLKKKVQTQNMIIVALAIIIVVLLVVSSSAAWYIRTKTDTADIILSNPVNIYITEYKYLRDSAGNLIYDAKGQPIKTHFDAIDILSEYNTRVYPGDKIKMQLGMRIGSEGEQSSPGYVRVKLTVTYENIYTGIPSEMQELVDSNLIKYKNEPDPNTWQLVDFNKFVTPPAGESKSTDYWYVLKTINQEGKPSARIAQNMELLEFIDGYIELNKIEITNAQANCKFHINYVVEAIQTVNVPNPLEHEGYGPWWHFSLGDEEDIL